MQNAAPEGTGPELHRGGLDNHRNSTSAARPQIYQITIRTPPGGGIHVIRAALKTLLRRFDLRCLRIEQLPAKAVER